jgi:phospholipid/cholesterol/gamma-HCH transport system ATP-binding protein
LLIAVTTPQRPGAANDPCIVRIRGLSYAAGTRAIFDGVDLDVQRGGVTAIMGPSGTGKTTLLRLITGQIRPHAGEVLVDGQDVTGLGRKGLYAMRRRMGMLFQNGALLSDFNVFENVAFPLREHTRLPDRLVRNIVLPKLHAVGLRGAAALMPYELSGGMARRVALARAIVMDPELLIYDEPFVGLDPISLGVVLRLIRELNDALGISSIVVSHDVREIAAVADRAYLLSGGRVLASGKPGDLTESEQPEVRQFMRGLPDGPVPFHYPARDYAEQLFGDVRS